MSIPSNRTIEKLEQLRRVVLSAADEAFFMPTLCGELDDSYPERPQPACGTTLCAIGHAACDLWFQEHTKILDVFEVKKATGPNGKTWLNVDRRYPYTDMFESIANVFGISHNDSACLFGALPHDDNEAALASKHDVTANIDRIIQGVPAIPYRGFNSMVWFDNVDDFGDYIHD
jgi:hypothetical protein